jgi:hypothetical protein
MADQKRSLSEKIRWRKIPQYLASRPLSDEQRTQVEQLLRIQLPNSAALPRWAWAPLAPPGRKHDASASDGLEHLRAALKRLQLPPDTTGPRVPVAQIDAVLRFVLHLAQPQPVVASEPLASIPPSRILLAELVVWLERVFNITDENTVRRVVLRLRQMRRVSVLLPDDTVQPLSEWEAAGRPGRNHAIDWDNFAATASGDVELRLPLVTGWEDVEETLPLHAGARWTQARARAGDMQHSVNVQIVGNRDVHINDIRAGGAMEQGPSSGNQQSSPVVAPAQGPATLQTVSEPLPDESPGEPRAEEPAAAEGKTGSHARRAPTAQARQAVEAFVAQDPKKHGFTRVKEHLKELGFPADEYSRESLRSIIRKKKTSA